MELVHGGDWAGYRARFGHDALDFSANVSPLGLPQGVADAIVAALPTADRYPDPLCRELRTALSRAEQLPEPWILCGNGAADLIYRLVWALKPRRALLPAPTFAEYAAALESVGCEVKRKTLHEADDFAVTEAFVDLVGLQMADKMPRLTAISVGVGLFHQFLHMVFAKQVNGQSGTGNHLFHGAGLAGGAQQNICRVAAGFTGGDGHIFTDAGHIFGHHCQLFLCQHGSHLLVNGAAAAGRNAPSSCIQDIVLSLLSF